MHGKNWKKVEEHVKTRTSTQARSHAQKFFANISKNKMTMEEFLAKLDLANLNNIFQQNNGEDYNEEELNKQLVNSMRNPQNDQEAKGGEKTVEPSKKRQKVAKTRVMNIAMEDVKQVNLNAAQKSQLQPQQKSQP